MLSPRLLGDGEVVVAHMRTHAKALIGPVLWLALLIAAAASAVRFLPEAGRPATIWVALALVLALAVWAVVLPALRWATTTYTVTDRRIITRRGIVTRVGHDLPIQRINDVTYERDLVDRLLGCGTLVLTTAAEQPVRLYDVPDVERIHVEMTNLLFRAGRRGADTAD